MCPQFHLFQLFSSQLFPGSLFTATDFTILLLFLVKRVIPRAFFTFNILSILTNLINLQIRNMRKYGITRRTSNHFFLMNVLKFSSFLQSRIKSKIKTGSKQRIAKAQCSLISSSLLIVPQTKRTSHTAVMTSTKVTQTFFLMNCIEPYLLWINTYLSHVSNIFSYQFLYRMSPSVATMAFIPLICF